MKALIISLKLIVYLTKNLFLSLIETLNNKQGMIVAFILALLSLFYTINSNIIAQNENGILVPFERVFQDEYPEEELKEIIGEKKETKMTYFFVLDISKSIRYNGKIPDWYEAAVTKINAVLSDENYKLEISDKKAPSGFLLCKVKICTLLLELRYKRAQIEIWKLGDEAHKVFSGEGEIENNENQSVKEAIKSIIKIKQDKADDTNFYDFFNKLLEHYIGLKKTAPNIYKSTKFILVVISDLIHDVRGLLNKGSKGNLQKKKAMFEENKQKLIDKINEISNINMLTNTIVLEFDKRNTNSFHQKFKFPIWKILEENFGAIRFYKSKISEEQDDLLVVYIKAKRSIYFYYDNPFNILKSSFIISISKEGKYRFGLTELKESPFPKIEIAYKIRRLNIDEKNTIKGILRPGKKFHETPELRVGDKIELSYSGRLPFDFVLPNFKIYFPKNEKKAYIVSLEFRQRFPGGSAIFMFVLFVFLVFVLIWTTVRFSKKYFDESGSL